MQRDNSRTVLQMKRVSGQSTPAFGSRNWPPKLNVSNLILVSDTNDLERIFSDIVQPKKNITNRVQPSTPRMAINTKSNVQFRAHTSMIKNV